MALLLLIPIVREVRTVGVSALPQALVSPRLDALVEMGESLRPVEQVVRWHAEGEPYQHGDSYWAPFERAAARVLPGLKPVAADNDLRLMNVLSSIASAPSGSRRWQRRTGTSGPWVW